MVFHAPPEWRKSGAGPDPDRRLSSKEKFVAIVLAAMLAVITLANCKMLMAFIFGG